MSLTAGSLNAAISVAYKATQTSPGSNATGAPTISTSGTASGPGTTMTLGFGTGSGQGNLFVSQLRTLALSTNETLDFFGGTVVDMFGNACVFGHIKHICITIYANGDVSGLTIEGGASNPFLGPLSGTTPAITIYPNGPGYQVGEPTVGWAVTTSVKNVKLVNNSSSVAVTYQIQVAGTTT